MIDTKALLTALQKRVLLLEDDMRDRCNKQPEVDAPLRKDYEAAREKGRTGLTYNAWRDEELTQISVAWVLSGVFVRFLEDNELIDVPFLAGGNAARHQRAQDEHSLFFRQHPTGNERDYFEHIFETVGKLPGMKDFFDRRHNPLWRVGPTADAAKALLEFWRKTDPDTGRIVHDFTDAGWNTRFLGDLYQDLSEFARKRYALLQTPVFVEQFILDRTLTPAIQTFGFKAVRMIDITCGSGHFLLGGFQRLFRLWQENEPGENPTVLARRALEQVFGVDLNPNVVAIARFRLLLAALRVCGVTRIKDAPDFRLNLAAGDSLLHGSRFSTTDSHEGVQQTFGGDELFRDELKHFYESEDREELHRILGQQYHVVVGNPPYIAVEDGALRDAYRRRFTSCHGRWVLAVPFFERFFDLAIKGDHVSNNSAGYVGKITGSNFMKREFGKKLVEKFIPRWDLTHVIDTDKAHIPGHATGTVIILGRHQAPVATTVRTVMGIRKQEPAPEDPANGLVWRAILDQVDHPNSESEFISVADVNRESFHKHPWSIGGGGASDLKVQLDEMGDGKLAHILEDSGVFGMTNADEVILADRTAFRRREVEAASIRAAISGDDARDWMATESEFAIFPYKSEKLEPIGDFEFAHRWLWPARTTLGNRATFDRETYFDAGLPWWKWHQVALHRLSTPLSIIWSEVATHNHFVLDRGGRVFKQTAPMIKLPGRAKEDDHLELLGVLNSSTACFWLKQVCHDKGAGGIGGGISAENWEHRFAHNATQVAGIPIPATKPLSHSRALDRFVQELEEQSPGKVLTAPANHTRKGIEAAKQHWTETLQCMIALQEELDWECYRLYGLTEAKLVLDPDQVPPVKLGERAFEIVMARKLAASELQTAWFERHRSTPVTVLPMNWPQPYRDLVQRRIALMESDRNIALIEQPEYKRRWNVEPWDEQLERALREWLLNRLEGYFFGGERMIESGPGNTEDRTRDGLATIRARWTAGQQPALVSTNQLAALVEIDADFLRVAEIYSGGPGFSVSKVVRELVENEAVPFLPFQRYKESGLRKRQDWEHVWDLQRVEDEFDAKIDPLKTAMIEATTVFERDPKSAEGETSIKRALQLKDQFKVLEEQKRNEIGSIPVPPKYTSADFKKSHWWKLRGKLDVPKERWIVYPGAERDGDPSPVIAWAGWDHLQQAKALASYYVDASTNLGWTPEKLQPLLAGVADLLPWLKQWYNQFDPEVTSGLGDYFAAFLDEEARKQETTINFLNEMRFSGVIQPTRQLASAVPNELGLGSGAVERSKAQSKETPEFASFADAYPSTEADKLVCALALEIVAWKENIESSDHLDALILATRPELCRIFATDKSTQLDAWTKPLKAELKAILTRGLKWVQCLKYLEEHRHALDIERNKAGRPIHSGRNFGAVRADFPCRQSGIAVFALSLLESIRQKRQSNDLSAEQTTALKTIDELHNKYALA